MMRDIPRIGGSRERAGRGQRASEGGDSVPGSPVDRRHVGSTATRSAVPPSPARHDVGVQSSPCCRAETNLPGVVHRHLIAVGSNEGRRPRLRKAARCRIARELHNNSRTFAGLPEVGGLTAALDCGAKIGAARHRHRGLNDCRLKRNQTRWRLVGLGQSRQERGQGQSRNNGTTGEVTSQR